MRHGVVHEVADGKRVQHVGHPSDVVGVGVGGHQEVDLFDAEGAESVDGRAAAGVHKGGLALRRLYEDRIGLSHVQEGDPQGGGVLSGGGVLNGGRGAGRKGPD